jgi:hypothetical protein
MARAGRWTNGPKDERQAIWWGLVWIAVNVALVVMIVLLAGAQ